MPSNVVKSFAKKYGTTTAKAEKKWKEAKAAAKKSYGEPKDDDKKFWGTTTKIFKNKMAKHGKKEGMITNFSEYINEHYQDTRHVSDNEYKDREDSFGAMIMDKLEDMREYAAEVTGSECDSIEDAIEALKRGDAKQMKMAQEMTKMYTELGKHKGWISENQNLDKK